MSQTIELDIPDTCTHTYTHTLDHPRFPHTQEEEEPFAEERRAARARSQAADAARERLRRSSTSSYMSAAVNNIRPVGGRSRGRRESTVHDVRACKQERVLHSTAFLRARQLAMAKTRFDDELCTAGPPRTARTKSKALLYKYALMSAVMSAG
eukprot:1160401-Pelagomonas_calceolata.AAC.9